MSATSFDQISRLNTVLAALRRRVWLFTVLRGASECLTVVLAGVLLAAGFDFLLPLPAAVRLLLLATVAVVTALAVWRSLILPLRDQLPDEELAAAVDLSFPELQESLATICSLDPAGPAAGDPGSATMREQMAAQISKRMSVVDPGKVMHHGRTWKRIGAASFLLLLAVVPALFWPGAVGTLMQRLVTPFANTGTVTNLYFSVPNANRVVALGTDVRFTAIPGWRTGGKGSPPENVQVELLAENGLRDHLQMSWDDVGERFSSVLPAISQSLQYRITGGGAETPWFELHAMEGPSITAATLTATPPVYSGRAVDVFDGIVGDLPVFERSGVEVVVEFSQPVQAVTMNWVSWQPIQTEIAVDEFEDGRPAGELVDRDNPLVVKPGVMTADGMTAIFQFDALASGQFEFRAENEFQLELPFEPERRLIVAEDAAPRLSVSGLQDGMSLRPTDTAPLDCVVSDDIGVDALDLYVRRNDQAERILPADGFERGARDVDWSFRIDLAALEVATGDVVSVRVRAADERPVPAPNIVWKGPWNILIDEQAAAIGRKPLDEADQQMIDQLKQLEQALADDADTVREMKNRVWQQWDEAARNETQQLSEKEQQQGRELQQVAEQIAEHPLMQEQAAAVSRIGERVARDIPGPLNAATKAERTEAANQLQQAVGQLDAARKALQEQIRQIEQLARIEQELAELNRLALDAEQLAQASDQLQEQQRSGQPEAGQSAEEFAEQLQQQAQMLEGDRQQLQQDLDDLLERQQELLEAARRSQQEQLSEIAEVAAKLSQDERRLSDGVQEEARDAARDSQPLAEELQQLRNDVRQHTQQSRQQAPNVQTAESEQLDQALQELRQGNLAAPQERVSTVGGQLDAAAEALREQAQQQQAMGDDSASAQTETLAQQSAELTERLARLNDRLREEAQQRIPEGQEQGGAEQADSVTQEMLDRLRELAESGQQLSEAVQQEDQAQRGAATQARQMADQGRQAAEAADAGQFDRAADRMRKAAAAAEQAANNFDNQQQTDRQNQLQSLGEEYQRLANTVQQLQEDNAAQIGTQQRSQQRIAEQASQLPQQLSEVKERMQLPALGMEPQARLAAEAQNAASDAAASGQQASEQLQQGQLQQAAQSGREASAELNRVAQLAGQAGQPQSNAKPLVPSEVGQNVADAMQSLQQAGNQLGQQQQGTPQAGDDSQSSGSQSGQQAASQSGAGEMGDPNAAPQDGQSSPASDAATGEGQQEGSGSQSSEGQPSSSSSGNGSPSQQLADAAKSLADAARNSLPEQFTPGQLSDGGESDGKSAMGNDSEFDGRDVARSAGAAVLRDWGKLQDELTGEMKTDGPEVIDREYSALIRRYRRELAKAVANGGKTPAGNE